MRFDCGIGVRGRVFVARRALLEGEKLGQPIMLRLLVFGGMLAPDRISCDFHNIKIIYVIVLYQ
jgi:hypothetical protein